MTSPPDRRTKRRAATRSALPTNGEHPRRGRTPPRPDLCAAAWARSAAIPPRTAAAPVNTAVKRSRLLCMPERAVRAGPAATCSRRVATSAPGASSAVLECRLEEASRVRRAPGVDLCGEPRTAEGRDGHRVAVPADMDLERLGVDAEALEQRLRSA